MWWALLLTIRHEVITEYEPNDLNIIPKSIGGQASSDAILVQLTFNEDWTLDQKQVLYAAIGQVLQQRMGLRPEDVAINVLAGKKGSQASWGSPAPRHHWQPACCETSVSTDDVDGNGADVVQLGSVVGGQRVAQNRSQAMRSDWQKTDIVDSQYADINRDMSSSTTT
jgi:Tautomerase enzyme